MYFLRLDQRLPWPSSTVTSARAAAYEGFLAGVSGFATRGAGIMVDRTSCPSILHDAASRGFTTACNIGPLDALDEEGGVEGIAGHAAACEATFWKATVRLDPEADTLIACRQAQRLGELSSQLRRTQRRRLICDLVVVPAQGQLAYGVRHYFLDLLPDLIARGMTLLLAAGVDPDLWVIEPLERRDDYLRVTSAAREVRRDAGCLVRIANHRDTAVREQGAVALSVPGVDGIAFGGAQVWQSVAAGVAGRSAHDEVVADVGAQVRAWFAPLEERRTA
jgi:hypothetical protein